MGKQSRLFYFGILFGVVALDVRANGSGDAPTPGGAKEKSGTVSLAATARKSVLVVECSHESPDENLGSGFVVRAQLVATNAHVVSDCTGISVSEFGSSKSHPAYLVRAFNSADIAFLYVPELNAAALPLGKQKDVDVGARILVIGHPEGLEFTVSDGIVSAIRDVGEGRTMLQLTAPISHGNSGGPVLDSRGRVIGMATLFFKEGQNLNFAVPADDIAIALGLLDLSSNSPGGAAAKLQSSRVISAAELAREVRVYRKEKEYDAAQRLLDDGLKKNPNDLALLLQAAELAWDQSRWEDASKYTDRMLALDPKFAPAHQCAGEQFLRQQRWDDAKRESQATLSLGADAEYSAYAHSDLVDIYLREKDYPSALSHVELALAYDELAQDPILHYQRAIALAGVGRRTEASGEAETAIRLAPTNVAMKLDLRAAGLPFGIRITSSRGERDSIGNFIAIGVVVNEGYAIASRIRIVAECFDENGVVVGTGYGYVEPDDIPPTLSGSFKIYVQGNPKLSKTCRPRLAE